MTTPNTTNVETLTNSLSIALAAFDGALVPTDLRAEGGEIVATYSDGTKVRYADLDALCDSAKLSDTGDAGADAEADHALAALERARTAPAREAAARDRWIAEHIHQLPSGRWIVAQHDARNANWIASMTPRAQRLTGCSQVSARTLQAVASDGNVQTYATKAAALRACREDIDAVAAY